MNIGLLFIFIANIDIDIEPQYFISYTFYSSNSSLNNFAIVIIVIIVIIINIYDIKVMRESRAD